MKYDYQVKYTVKIGEKIDFNYINEYCRTHPGIKLLVEIPNTKGISSSDIKRIKYPVMIRIAGAYDADIVRNYGNDRYSNGETGQYFTDAVIYTLNETIKILEEIEKIEKGYMPNWSDFQKFVYVYEKLKGEILYDPKFETKLSSEIRSLRGLISKKTVCAGYAVILKELMDRQGIKCEYAHGKSGSGGGHAWNLVTLDGKMYGIDLTWDSSDYRRGNFKSRKWLGQDVREFCKNHHPDKLQRVQDYEHKLSQFDSNLINVVIGQINIQKDYSSTTFHATREDGSKFIVSQVGSAEINGVKYYRYYYIGNIKDGRGDEPLLLYSDTNVAFLIDSLRFNRSVPKGYNYATLNYLFSQKNIQDSLRSGTYYIGSTEKESNSNKKAIINSVEDIRKPENIKNLFRYKVKNFKRSSGSTIIVQKWPSSSVLGYELNKYDIFEVVHSNGQNIVHRNTVYSEQDFFLETRQDFVDDFLNRDRLDRKVREAGGYIGYYSKAGRRTYNPDLSEYFSIAKKVDFNYNPNDKKSNNNRQSNNYRVNIPSFLELKMLASNCRLVKDNSDTNELGFRVIDYKSKNEVHDKGIALKAMFADLWLNSAALKIHQNEERPGMEFAFNSSNESLYLLICTLFERSVKRYGVINPQNVVEEVVKIKADDFTKEVLVNLFNSKKKIKVINELFVRAYGVSMGAPDPDALSGMYSTYTDQTQSIHSR